MDKKQIRFTATQIKTETKRVFDAADVSDYVVVTNFDEPKYVIIRYEKFKEKVAEVPKKRPDIRLIAGPLGDGKKKIDAGKFFRELRNEGR